MKNLKMAMAFIAVFTPAVFITGCQKNEVTGEPVAEPSVKADFDGQYLKVVNFDFDKSEISSLAASILKENAQYLSANLNINIVVEGHCDSRGTVAYNLALGQRRALKVKEYYVSLGIASDRIAAISYGEEKPVDPEENEDAYAKNRRAETKMVSK
ncbi:MAG: OmpA family protein [Elusimicrobiota bacterium]|jgi:peptidoglycan-associated lipoprotein|nr:OmpA family protein [Elusimicrobiota bacterium]